MLSQDHPKKEENVFKQAWHSVEEALHLRSEPEDVPPPVPEKDERWKVKTVNKAVPLGQTAPEEQADPRFWDKLFHHKKTSSPVTAQDNDDTDDWVSISVPADAALKHLGVQGDDQDLEDKKNYFKRMAARVQEKFDDDSDDSDDDSDNDDKATPKTEEEKREKQQRKKLAPKVDPKEMKAAHKAIYQTVDSDDDDEADKKMFGSWWGCHPRRSWAERKLAKEREAEAERQRVLAELAAQKKAEEEAAAAAAAAEAARNKWWKFGLSKSPEEKAAKEKERARAKERKERKTTTHKRQAIASAAAYEAVKEYQAHEAKKGKKTSHGEMKAILAGMAMAEAIKLLSKDNEDDEDARDETVADAGSKVLKLFELMN
ncbi:hypothetical protein CPC16_002381 [Podila verticillata]|nr:hypothetical protein BGZ59_008777 [Podila verticillata]KAF9372532.1 hypothetical protein CPC16_002381 [Podila verticillata]KAI9231681.1 MAG: hypothetical protein BYD32DRAFT_466928 [Podila humilis]KFH69554.1 hypothetical protein MVEG_04365 [Podila verticillata NRRL 6337]